MRAVCLILTCAIAGAAAAGSPTPKIDVDQNGLRSLTWNGEGFLADGAFRVLAAPRRTRDGRAVETSVKPVSSKVVDASKLVQEYEWGTVSCAYAAAAGRLDLEITVRNASDAVVRGVLIQPMVVRFPDAVAHVNPNWPRLGHNVGGPTVLTMNYGGGAVAFVNEDIHRPLVSGFLWASDKRTNRVRPMRIQTTDTNWLGGRMNRYVEGELPPGRSDSFHVSLRFGGPDASADDLAGDVYERFVRAYPFRQTWDDRRPIGALFLSTSNTGWETNPRGWLRDKSIDVTTAAGRQAFRRKMLDFAERSRDICRDVGAQGVMIWDIEGQEYPHATSYLGDPRSLPPEMDAIADELMKVFTGAELRVGVTIRPQRPIRPAYDARVRQAATADPVRTMIEKIGYAKKRWGCELFYIDSNGDPNVPMPADWFRRVHDTHPDVLLMPEHETLKYYAYAAPYEGFQHSKRASTPAGVRRVYPQAFSAIYVPDGPVAEKRAELVEGVRRGDILLFRGWFGDRYNDMVKSIYAEAGRHDGE